MELDVNGDPMQTPTADDIARAVDAAPEHGDWYLNLEDDDSYIEARLADGAFRVVSDEEGERRQSASPVDAARLKEMFVLYLQRDQRWPDVIAWIAEEDLPRVSSAARRASAPPKWAPFAVVGGIAALTIGGTVLPGLLSRWIRLPPPFDSGDGLIFAFIIASVIIAVIVLVAVKVWQSRRAAAWPQAGGRILKSGVEPRYHESSEDGTTVKNVPAVEYEFSVAGTKYLGTRIGIGEDTGGTDTAATLQRYPVGATVMVHYDPADPSNCVLEPNLPEGLGKGCLVLLAIAAAFGAGIYWLATRGPDLVTSYFPKAEAPFVLVAIGFSAFTLLFFFAMRRQAKEAARWPVARGSVVASTTESVRKTDSDGHATTTHAPAVEYAYRVAGRDYRGRQIALGTKVSGSQAFATKIAARYSEGRDVDVHYDPKNPANAALEISSSGYWFVLAIAVAVFGIAVYATGVFRG